MAPDSTQAITDPIPKPETPPRCKFRVRFRKAGDLRLLSHHDLMHVFERLFRRADLQVHVTQGFNPRPKMWFAASLALGIAGLNEVFEFELAQIHATEEIERRLARQCPPGIEFLSVRAIDVKMSAHVRRGFYRLALTHPVDQVREGEVPGELDNLPQRCLAFFDRPDCWVERPRPRPRRINIRPFVDELHAHADRLEMALWITPNGAARPEEVIAALSLQYLLDAGTVIERTDLEICDELPPGTPSAPVILAAIEESSANDRELPSESARPTPIMDDPMSFDS